MPGSRLAVHRPPLRATKPAACAPPVRRNREILKPLLQHGGDVNLMSDIGQSFRRWEWRGGIGRRGMSVSCSGQVPPTPS
jgi:hypothetical protein